MKKQNGSGATTQDIARLSGVSTATVSYVLSGRKGVRISQQTRERVLEAAKRLHYRRNALATALRKGRTNTLGIVAPYSVVGQPSSSHLVYGKDLILALTFAAARLGMGVMLYVDSPDSPLTPEHVTDRRVDGVVLSGIYGVREWVDSIVSSGTSCVEIGSTYGEYQVHPDNALGSRFAVEHLLTLGHRRIVHWRGPESALAAKERSDTFSTLMAGAGVPEPERQVVSSAEEIERLFLLPERPTAIFTYNDNRAVDAYHLLHKLGLRIPEDVSIVGFDNDIRAVSVLPPLTTVQNPVDEIADSAVRLLVDQIEGGASGREVVRIPNHLVARESTGPVP